MAASAAILFYTGQVYDPVRKEILTLWNGTLDILRFNINNKSTSVVTLNTSSDFWYTYFTNN